MRYLEQWCCLYISSAPRLALHWQEEFAQRKSRSNSSYYDHATAEQTRQSEKHDPEHPLAASDSALLYAQPV